MINFEDAITKTLSAGVTMDQIDLEEELVKILSQEITQEIDNQILQGMGIPSSILNSCSYCGKSNCEIMREFKFLYKMFGYPQLDSAESIKINLKKEMAEKFAGDILLNSFSLKKGNNTVLNYFSGRASYNTDTENTDAIKAVAGQYKNNVRLIEHGIEIE